MMARRRRFVLGITGASGAPYAERFIKVFAEQAESWNAELHIVFTKFGRLVWDQEIGTDPKQDIDFPIYSPQDMMAPFASGSARFDGMVILPCSAGTLSRAAVGISTDLVSRAADVMLKERKRLIAVVRESPYNLVQLRNMTTLVEAGAVVMPASPSFYSKPESHEAFLDTVVARVFDALDLDNDLMTRWGERP